MCMVHLIGRVLLRHFPRMWLRCERMGSTGKWQGFANLWWRSSMCPSPLAWSGQVRGCRPSSRQSVAMTPARDAWKAEVASVSPGSAHGPVVGSSWFRAALRPRLGPGTAEWKPVRDTNALWATQSISCRIQVWTLRSIDLCCGEKRRRKNCGV